MNLTKLRKEKNLTQAELSEKLKVTRSTVAMWELGLSSPKIEHLKKMAKLFGCTVDDLIKEEE